MKIKSPGIEDGRFLDRYGSKGDVTVNGMPGLSIPFSIKDAPANTKSFAAVLDDYDAIPVCGFNWIHWTLCNLHRDTVSEGESHNDPDFVEGCNSWHSIADELSVEEATGYGGMAPPNCEHRYTLKVFALDCDLDLERGFMLNDLIFAMEGHVLDFAVLTGTYSPADA